MEIPLVEDDRETAEYIATAVIYATKAEGASAERQRAPQRSIHDVLG